MTPDQGISSQEKEPVFSNEVILLDKEAVIIDNLIGVKYSRLKYLELNINKTKSKRLKIIFPLDQNVESWRNGAQISLYPIEIEGDYKIVLFNLSAKNSSVRTGDYTISSDLVSSAEGHGVLLKIESPNPIARAIVEDLSSKKIAQGLTLYNKS